MKLISTILMLCLGAQDFDGAREFAEKKNLPLIVFNGVPVLDGPWVALYIPKQFADYKPRFLIKRPIDSPFDAPVVVYIRNPNGLIIFQGWSIWDAHAIKATLEK